MILEGLAVIGAAVGVAVIGAPIASSLARVPTFNRKVNRDPDSTRKRVEVARAFQPLDLGPDPVRWPSERPWTLSSSLPDPDWPSKAWTDVHFGRHWKDGSMKELEDRGFHAMAARHAGESGALVPPRQAPPHAHTPRERKAAREEKAREEQTQTQSKQAKQGKQSRQTQEAKPSQNRRQGQKDNRANQEAERRQRQIALEQAKAEARASSKAPPDVAEIEHLVSTVGLAETVKAIMQRTGWDFREAAQYLAKIRQGR